MKRRIGIGRTSGTFIGLASLGLLLLLPSIVASSLGLVSVTKPAPPVAPGLIAGLLQKLPPPPIPLPASAAHSPLYVAVPTTPPAPKVTTPPGVSATVSSLSAADTLSPGSTASSHFSVTDTGHTALNEIALSIHGTPGIVTPYLTVALSSPNGNSSLPLTSALAGSELMVPVAIQPGGTATLTLTVSLAQAAPRSVEGLTSGYTLALYAS
jgi:hypothetical protein